jgi:outer membrane immunogenic protein
MNSKKYSAVVGIALLSSSVMANELATKSPYDWTGVYVGGFIGGATGADVTNTATRNIDGTLWNYPGDANNNYSAKAGFIGGGTIGYNWHIGKTPYVIGLEGEYGYLSQKGSKTDPNAATYNAINVPTTTADNSQSSTSIGTNYGYGLIGGRIGYALDRSLIYVKSGAIFTSVNSSWSDTNYALGTSNNGTTTGYALGCGFEYALPFKHLTDFSVKTEYLYFGIPKNSTLTTQTTEQADPLSTYQATSGIHTAKIGVNYKF